MGETQENWVTGQSDQSPHWERKGGEAGSLTDGDFPYKCKCFLQKGNYCLVFIVFPPTSAVS